MTSSRRRFLRRIGGVIGVSALPSTAGCTRSNDLETEQSPPPGGFGQSQTPDGSPTPTPGSTPTQTATDTGGDTTVSTVATDVDPIAGSWPSYRLDAANSAATDDPGPQEDPALVWRRETAAGVRPATGPAAAGGVFVVVMSSGEPSALGAGDGRIRWQADRQVSTDVDPIASGGTVVVADDGELVGLSVETGDERWAVSVSGGVVGLATGDEVVVAATDAGLTALALDDGTELWTRPVDGTVATRPAVGDGSVAVSLASGVVALDAASGDERWRQQVGEGGFRPAVGDGHVYVATAELLEAFDADDGDRAWTVTPDLPVRAAPVTGDDAVYLATFTDDADPEPRETGTRTATPLPTDARRFAADLLALSADGTERWRSGASGRWNFTSGPPELGMTAMADRVYVSVDETLLAYDASDGSGAWSVEAGRGATVPAVVEDVVSTGVVGAAVADGEELWRFEVGDRVESSPAVDGNTVYVGSDDHHLYAVTANSGAVEWRTQTGGQVKSSPAVDDSTVYVGSADGHLYAFDREDGTRRWRFDTGGPVESSPTLRDGVVYVGSRSGLLFAVDADSGEDRWHVDYGGEFLSATPAVADGSVYAGANDVFRALDAEDGAEQWRVDVGPTRVLQSIPAVSDGRVFLNPGEALHAFDATDGTERWARPTQGTVVNAPAVRDGTVFTPGGEYVYAFDVETGDREWRTSVGRAGWVVAGDDAVFAAGVDGAIVALDPDDGSERWRLDGVAPTRSPAVAGEYLFVGDYEGGINAVGPNPG